MRPACAIRRIPRAKYRKDRIRDNSGPNDFEAFGAPDFSRTSSWPNGIDLKARPHALVRQRINHFTVRNEFASLVSNSQAGDRFPTPFAKPPRRELSSPTVNVIWSWINLVVGYVLFQAGKVSSEDYATLIVVLPGIVFTSTGNCSSSVSTLVRPALANTWCAAANRRLRPDPPSWTCSSFGDSWAAEFSGGTLRCFPYCTDKKLRERYDRPHREVPPPIRVAGS